MSIKTHCTVVSWAISTAILVSACGESTSSEAGAGYGNTPAPSPIVDSFNQQALLENLVDNVISPTFVEFADLATSQIQPIEAYCQLESEFALGNASIEQVNTAREQAKQAWRSTMNVWQQAEVMRVGPLAENDALLRNKIYSWPAVNTCSVDFEVVNYELGTVNGQPYDIANRTPSRRGLAALEYLLFNEQLDHSCTSTTQPENWNSQSDDYRKIARCDFAGEFARDINNNAQQLLTAWQGANGYGNTLKQAGTTDSDFTTELQAINEISDAMFYVDKFTKDGKLAEPLGILFNPCGGQACPETVESLFSGNSVSNIEQNLLAFAKLFSGDSSGVGFVDFLTDVGDQLTADEMTADITSAINNTQNYEQSLADALTTDPDKVQQTHTDVKKITDKLKTDFIQSLALELPQTAAGDND
jgi:predicted lipoprotein